MTAPVRGVHFLLPWILAVVAGIARLQAREANEIKSSEVDIRRDATVEAIETVLPTVVNIAATTLVDSTDPQSRMMAEFFGWRVRTDVREVVYSRGSGVVIDEEGYVLTNVHVVKNAARVFVRFNDNEEELEAERIGLNAQYDVALLKIKSTPGRKFKAIRFGKDDDLLLGETVVALGNPFALRGSVSRGILSSKARRGSTDKVSNESLDSDDWLQTDAAINPGNSGGPLINLRGELIGINVAVLGPSSGAQGIGFAIPIKRVNEALSGTLSADSLRGLWFGARLQNGTRPLTIQAVQPGSPADKAGMQAGDIIVLINGGKPESLIDFNRELLSANDRRDISVLVARNGQQRELTLRLIQEKDFFNAEFVRRKLGITLDPLTPQLLVRMGLSDGLMISNVERGGPASQAEVERGMILMGLNSERPTTVVEAAKALFGKKRGEPIELTLLVTERTALGYRPYVGKTTIKVR